MRIIAIRGIAGAGKTELADRVAQELGAEVLHVDWLKTGLKKAQPEKDWPEIRTLAYDAALKKVEEARTRGVSDLVIEELFIDESFISALRTYCVEKSVHLEWVRVERDIEKLLRTEQERVDRPIRNSRENLEHMQEQLEATPIPEERVVRNEGSFDEVSRKIVSLLE